MFLIYGVSWIVFWGVTSYREGATPWSWSHWSTGLQGPPKVDTCILTSLQALRDPNARLDEGNVDGSAGLFLFVCVALCLNIGGSFLNCVLSTDSTVNLMNNQVDNNNNTVMIIRCVNNDYTDFQRMSPSNKPERPTPPFRPLPQMAWRPFMSPSLAATWRRDVNPWDWRSLHSDLAPGGATSGATRSRANPGTFFCTLW